MIEFKDVLIFFSYCDLGEEWNTGISTEVKEIIMSSDPHHHNNIIIMTMTMTMQTVQNQNLFGFLHFCSSPLGSFNIWWRRSWLKEGCLLTSNSSVEVFLCTDDVFGQVGGVTLYTTLPITIQGMFSGHGAKTESMVMQLCQHTERKSIALSFTSCDTPPK